MSVATLTSNITGAVDGMQFTGISTWSASDGRTGSQSFSWNAVDVASAQRLYAALLQGDIKTIVVTPAVGRLEYLAQFIPAQFLEYRGDIRNDAGETVGVRLEVQGNLTDDQRIKVESFSSVLSLAATVIAVAKQSASASVDSVTDGMDIQSLINIILLNRQDALTDVLKGKLSKMQADQKQMDGLNKELDNLRTQYAALDNDDGGRDDLDAQIKAKESAIQTIVNISQREMIETNQLVNKLGESGTLTSNINKSLNDVNAGIANKL